MRALLAAAAALLGASCGRYADFTLPAAPGDAARSVRWEWQDHGAPVLAPGPDGADRVDALNPSVVATPGGYLNLYSGWDGRSWSTLLATSADGLAWQKQGPVLTPDPATWEGRYIAANGATLAAPGGGFLHWYQGASSAEAPPRIGLARSADGRRWTREAAPVLEPGPRGAWDERGVGDPFVVRAGDAFYLYYLGQDRARRQRLGVAVSPDGVRWTKLRSNPVLELGSLGSFDEVGLGEPAVWPAHGRWWMLYTGRDRGERRRIGLAVSPDGVRWERTGPQPLIAGAADWNSQVVCDPEIAPLSDGSFRVWYGGGDRPQPAENLHGHLGAGLLRAR